MMSGPWGDGGLGDAERRMAMWRMPIPQRNAIVGHGVVAGEKMSLTVSGQTRAGGRRVATGVKWPLPIT